MLEPWNNASLLPPPVQTFKCDINLDLQQLSYTCNSIVKVLLNQSPLHREAAICSRFLYKFDKKFRHDIGYRNLKKVNTALRKFLTLNLAKDAENLISILPSKDDEIYLPTRQMLEYIMLRLMGFARIMLRICVCSKQAAILYFDRVKRGESHWMSFMPYSLLSRIWSISLVLLQHSCQWYTNLFSFLDKLQLKGLHFLPAGYKLPTDIDKWLDMENLDKIGKFNWSQKKRINFEQLMPEDEENDVINNILDFVNQLNEDVSEEENEKSNVQKQCKPNQHLKAIKDDLEDNLLRKITLDQGEKISRNMFKSFYKSESNTKSHSAQRVTNKESLKQFLTLEEKYRNENSNLSLTDHLSFMQWQSLKKSLEALYESLAKNRKIEKKFQKLWKEKCLDYK